MSAFSFLLLIRIAYPSSTIYGKTALSILNSLATQTQKVNSGRDRLILYGIGPP